MTTQSRLAAIAALNGSSFDAVWPVILNIESTLTYGECQMLYRLADRGPGIGVITEIGSYLGRSAAALGYGSRLRRGDPVYTIDHHEGDPHSGYALTLSRLHRNIETAGLSRLVHPVCADSLNAAAEWDRGTIRLLFIDGYHTYDATKADYTAWRVHLFPGAVIAFHDYAHRDGVRQFVDELIAQTGMRLARKDSMAVVSEGDIL